MTNQSNAEVNLRKVALKALMQIDEGKKSHIVIKKTLDLHNGLDKAKRSFITVLVNGTVERQLEIDYIINQFSKTPTAKMKPVIRCILRMSVYQIKYMDSVPDSAVCNEAVKLTKKMKFTNLASFVNGVLRNIVREIDNVECENRSIKYSVPQWMISLWDEQYGKEKTTQILNKIYDRCKTTVRCNTSMESVDNIIKSLEDDGAVVTKSNIYENALILEEYDSLNKLTAFKKGLITVQNLSSMLVGILANPNPGSLVVDVCAAPGGKSLHICDLLNGTGRVIARDISKSKIDLIEQNINRIKFKNIETEIWDATKLDEKLIEKADVVVADLPCSGLGDIGNKSDIKYNISLDRIKQLADLQKEILSVASQYVKPGGKMIFSTCTVNKYENDDNVKWILDNLPFKAVSIKGQLPSELTATNEGCIQIYPGEFGMDGFFISVFEKE